MPETNSDSSLNGMFAKITKDLREQIVTSRIDMVEGGYVEIGEEYFDALRDRAQMRPHEPFLRPTPDVERALRKAMAWHAGQRRKDLGRKIPYVSHVLCVAEILARHGADETTVIAGILHDVIEDTAYTLDQLTADFGSEVAEIVRAVSEEKIPARSCEESWLDRKKNYLKKLTTAPARAVLVSCADKIHNLTSLRDAYRISGAKIWQGFHAPPEKKLWFYEEVLKITSLRMTGALVEELVAELARMKVLLPPAP